MVRRSASRGQTLVEQHLAALQKSGAPHVLLITDLEYVEYQGIVFKKTIGRPSREWSPETGWCADEELTCELSPALEGVELDEETLRNGCPRTSSPGKNPGSGTLCL